MHDDHKPNERNSCGKGEERIGLQQTGQDLPDPQPEEAGRTGIDDVVNKEQVITYLGHIISCVTATTIQALFIFPDPEK